MQLFIYQTQCLRLDHLIFAFWQSNYKYVILEINPCLFFGALLFPPILAPPTTDDQQTVTWSVGRSHGQSLYISLMVGRSIGHKYLYDILNLNFFKNEEKLGHLQKIFWGKIKHSGDQGHLQARKDPSKHTSIFCGQ